MPSVTRSKGAGERRVTITGDTVERRANKIVLHSRNAKGLRVPISSFRARARSNSLTVMEPGGKLARRAPLAGRPRPH